MSTNTQSQPVSRPSGAEIIAEERLRQIQSEGWNAEHDDHYKEDELARAAACYTLPANLMEYQEPGFFDEHKIRIPVLWPWEARWYKPAFNHSPESRIRELAKAGALIAAEIDRLHRLIDAAQSGRGKDPSNSVPGTHYPPNPEAEVPNPAGAGPNTQDPLPNTD